jgi:hypothetical protein
MQTTDTAARSARRCARIFSRRASRIDAASIGGLCVQINAAGQLTNNKIV